jgi:hypothetical protein
MTAPDPRWEERQGSACLVIAAELTSKGAKVAPRCGQRPRVNRCGSRFSAEATYGGLTVRSTRFSFGPPARTARKGGEAGRIIA